VLVNIIPLASRGALATEAGVFSVLACLNGYPHHLLQRFLFSIVDGASA